MAYGYENISKSLQQAGALFAKEATITDDTIVEGLKQYRDLLEAFKVGSNYTRIFHLDDNPFLFSFLFDIGTHRSQREVKPNFK